jgi:hypothetical protein
VFFDKKAKKHIYLNARSLTGGTLLISTEGAQGEILAKINIPKGDDWSVVKKAILLAPTGVKNLVVKLKSSGNVEVDWVSFE